jgi:uncharacterized membrane protein
VFRNAIPPSVPISESPSLIVTGEIDNRADRRSYRAAAPLGVEVHETSTLSEHIADIRNGISLLTDAPSVRSAICSPVQSILGASVCATDAHRFELN